MANKKVGIEVTPFVCRDCGQLQIMADQVRSVKPGNCDACGGGNVERAGEMQPVLIAIFGNAAQSFEKGNTP